MTPTISCSRRRARCSRASPASSRALSISIRTCRWRPGSAADRPTRLQRCGYWRGPTILPATIRAFTRPRAQPAPTCRSVSIRDARLMRGIGEKLSAPLALPPLHALLVNPGAALSTRDVFAGWTAATQHAVAFDLAALANPAGYQRLLQLLMTQGERSRRRSDRARAGDRRGACGIARAARLRSRPHVGVRRVVLRAVFVRGGSDGGGQNPNAPNIRTGGRARAR